MMTLQSLIVWGLSASLLASGGARKLAEPILNGMAQAAIDDPIVPGDDLMVRTVMSIEVALAWHEGSNQLDPIGPNDGGNSHCWAQIYLPNGGKTREGWSGNELRHDPLKCAKVAVRLIKASLAASPTCNNCGLVIYARGRDTEEGRHLSQVRMGLAQRLMREVTWVP